MLFRSPSVDTEGLPSFTNVRTSQFCYTYLHKRWSYSIGIENPIVSYTTNNHTSFVNQRAPQIPAYIQYTWGYANESSVRLSGIVRNMQYRDLLQNKNHNMTGWGVQLSGQAILNRIVTLYYQGVYGKGVGNLIQDINGIGIDLVPATSESGKLKAPKAFGFYGGIKFNYSSKLFSTHMYSQVRDYAKYYSNGTMDWNQQYKYGQDLVNNLFYVYNSMIILGIEYDWGRKTIMSGEKRNDNRIQAMVQFSF